MVTEKLINILCQELFNYCYVTIFATSKAKILKKGYAPPPHRKNLIVALKKRYFFFMPEPLQVQNQHPKVLRPKKSNRRKVLLALLIKYT